VDDNLHTDVASRHHHRFSISVWVDILSDQHFRTICLTYQTNSCSVPMFLVPLEHVPLHKRQYTWFVHAGAPSHLLRIVRQHLNQTSGGQWTGRRGPVKWPA
jgi:hypothetical protein